MNIEEFEARLKKIDERAKEGDVRVSVEGETESSAVLNVTEVVKLDQTDHIDFAWGSNRIESLELSLLSVNLNDVEVSDDYIQQRLDAAFSESRQMDELPGVTVKQLGSSGDYEVMEDYVYRTRLLVPEEEEEEEEEEFREYSITAPAGFIYDRASIPRIFWPLIDKDSLSGVPPLFHDLLYRNGGVLKSELVMPDRTFTRDEADNLFYELMKKSGVIAIRCHLAYIAVHYFGGSSWRLKIDSHD